MDRTTVTAEGTRIKIISNTVQELSLARDLGSVMKIVRTVARKLTGADGATFILREGDLCYYADEDAISPLWKGSRFPLQSCISGWVILNKVPAAIEDIYQDIRIPHDAYRPTFVKSLVMVPIRTLDPLGAIGIYWATRHLPAAEEVDLLQALADITAVSIENIYVYKELEQRVQDRTSELETANKELEAFSYSVSHDLKAPIRLILNYSGILGADKLTDESLRALNAIQRSAQRMNTLVEDLLNLSKLNKLALAKTQIDVMELVKTVVDECKKLVPNNAQITFTGLHPVVADRSLIQQVWVNLISNAIKYSCKKDNPLIEISSSEKEHHIVYAVKDNGVGFSMDHSHKLFNVFQRLHSAVEFEGSGIGLALSHRIITRHGGEIWASGEIDQGATFYFSLPHVTDSSIKV